jgi:hypothetical protein
VKRDEVGMAHRKHEYTVTLPPKSMIFCHQNIYFSTCENAGNKNANGDFLNLNFHVESANETPRACGLDYVFSLAVSHIK